MAHKLSILAHWRVVIYSIFCFIFGIIFGVIMSDYVIKILPWSSHIGNVTDVTSDENSNDLGKIEISKDIVDRVPGAGIYPLEDMAFFATFLLALDESETTTDHRVVCIGVVGMNHNEQQRSAEEANMAPDIPQFLLDWIRRVNPNVTSLRDCVEKWDWQNTTPKLGSEQSRLIVVKWPQGVFPNYMVTSSLEFDIGGIHANGKNYLLRNDGGKIILVDTDDFRNY